MSALIAAAEGVLDFMRVEGWPCCVIGGLAVQRWGEPRLTQDVDLSVAVGVGREGVFVDTVLGRFPGRRPDAREFALAYRVLLVRASNGVAVDLALGSTGFELESIRRATGWEPEPGHSVLTCSAEDLIVHKLIAGRPRDVADIDGVVARQFDRLDMDRIRELIGVLAEVTENPGMGRPFERAMELTQLRRGRAGAGV